jgi:uncharacterized membrane protein (UPF0127 family)
MRLLLATAFVTMIGCSHNASSSSGSGAGARPEPEVVLVRGGQELHVKVELARTEPDRQRGLMFRQSLEPGRGMLFLFEHPDKLKFWMRNTYIPLDMIFISQDKRVVFVEENAAPLNDLPRGPEELTQFVLEVPGGWARAHGVGPGVEVRFLNVD